MKTKSQHQKRDVAVIENEKLAIFEFDDNLLGKQCYLGLFSLSLLQIIVITLQLSLDIGV